MDSQMRSQLSREDMLRELELLPVWQLKKSLPLATTPAPGVNEPALVVQEHIQPIAESPAPESLQDEVALPQATVEPVSLKAEMFQPVPLRLLLSEDGVFAFLIEPHPAGADADAVETLLKNMIRAMHLNCRVDVTNSADQLFAGHTPRLIISMGAAPANLLLGRASDLDAWRNDQHETQPLYADIPLLVTYHPAHLLQNAADKAHAWRDLCHAMKLVQRL